MEFVASSPPSGGHAATSSSSPTSPSPAASGMGFHALGARAKGQGGPKYQLGWATDIGGGRENQDDAFIYTNQTENILVIGVLDGHGREVGKIAAAAARRRLIQFFEEKSTCLKTKPYETLVEAHVLAHEHVKESFRVELSKQGFDIAEAPEGYLMKRRSPSAPWSCVHGGSSCSIIAIVGYKMYIANVGDSTGTLCSTMPILDRAKHLKHVGDSATPPGLKADGTVAGGAEIAASKTPNPVDTMVITAEHSPESPYEFCRMRAFRCREGDPSQPSLHVVYDAPAQDKTRCSPVFEFDDAGNPISTNRGKYYKNVRKEWASLVSTPATALYQDALAFTRSMGDLHLHVYGVTHYPEVHSIDLEFMFDELEAATLAAASALSTTSSLKPSSAPPSAPSSPTSSSSSSAASHINSFHPTPTVPVPLLCIVLATDGVWDNWLYEDVTKFVIDSSCLGAVCSGVDGCHRVAESFMQRNSIYAKRNFGNQADNATSVVVYLSDHEQFLAQSTNFDTSQCAV